MSRNRGRLVLSFVFVLFSVFSAVPSPGADPWQKIGEGLHFGAFHPPITSKIYDSRIIILKVDLKFHALKLLCASEKEQRPRTARQWCEEFGLRAAINAGMYQSGDSLKSTGFMKNHGHLNNPRMNKDFGSILLFDPVNRAIPPVQMIDRRLQKNWEGLMSKYLSAVQNYRLISRGKKRGWPQRAVLHSTAAVGLDGSNHVLLILSLSPSSTHDFIMKLLARRIDIKSAMYFEGGLEASLYLKMEDRGAVREGRREMDFISQSPVGIPNVIGIVKR